MSVDISISCNECGRKISNGDRVVCDFCLDDVKDDLNDARDEIKNLEERNKELVAEIESLRSRIYSLERSQR